MTADTPDNPEAINSPQEHRNSKPIVSLEDFEQNRSAHKAKGTATQDQIDRGLAQNIYDSDDQAPKNQFDERSGDSAKETQSDKYIPDKLSDQQFKGLKDIKKTRTELDDIRHEINNHGKDPIKTAIDLMKANRILGLGEYHTDSPQTALLLKSCPN